MATPRPRQEVLRLLTERLCPCGCGSYFTPTYRQASYYLSGRNNTILAKKECIPRWTQINNKGRRRRAEAQNARIEHNVMACFYCVKSPDRIEYTFRNAANFVRENPQLFDDQQRATRPSKGSGRLSEVSSNAAGGLRSLFNKIPKYQRDSYRGWTAVWKKDRLGNIVWQRPDLTQLAVTTLDPH